METLYRKVAVSDRNPPKSGTYFTNEGTVFYASTYNGFEHNTDPYRVYPDWWLEEIPDPTSQLEADKEEMLEALENANYLIKSIKNDCSESDLHEYYDICMKIESKNQSLIQKHRE